MLDRCLSLYIEYLEASRATSDRLCGMSKLETKDINDIDTNRFYPLKFKG